MSLSAYRCYSCKEISDSNVFICENSHIYCNGCAEEADKFCRCQSDLTEIPNPLEVALENVNYNCSFKENGCTWTFPRKDLSKHLNECKYRPFNCIGQTMNVWVCAWQGLKYQLADHFKSQHASLGEFYNHSEEGSVKFNDNDEKLVTALNLIDAFNKSFVFYYQSDGYAKQISMIIFLLGRKQDAEKYWYEIEIQTPEDKYKKLKFSHTCCSDNEPVADLIKQHYCLSVSYSAIKHFVHDKLIPFRFRVNKKDVTELVPTKLANENSVLTTKKSKQECTVKNKMTKPMSSNQLPRIVPNTVQKAPATNTAKPAQKLEAGGLPKLKLGGAVKTCSINKIHNPLVSPSISPSIHKNLFVQQVRGYQNADHIRKEQIPEIKAHIKKSNASQKENLKNAKKTTSIHRPN